MNRSLSPNMLRPNLPLRKPSSSPMMAAPTAATCPRLPGPGAASPLRLASPITGDGSVQSPVKRNQSALFGSVPPELTAHFCSYCGQQGNFRCKRCKTTSYCSVVCQTEDWKAHRHICKSIDPQPAKENPKDITALPVSSDQTCQLDLKPVDDTSLQRVYLKDLNMGKVMSGTEIQASFLEFYSPARFYVLAQNPEQLEAMRIISTELQKAYSCPSVTTYVPCVGEVCGVQFSCDMNWYRGLVKTLSADQKMAKILYIDFGNEEDVPVERIRTLTAKIQPFCPCAMECRIGGVVPSAGSWSGECCMMVRQLLTGKTVAVKLLETLENGRIYAVDILLSLGNRLSTFLIEHGFAVEEPSSVNVNPTRQEISTMTNVSLENFKRCSNGMDDNSWAQPPEPLKHVVGDSFSVVITHFQSPDEIIVQKVEHAGVIQQMLFNLREHCCQVTAPHNFRPAPNTVCCAQFSEDKQWYRAKILAYPSEERVCIGYLDFGNSEVVEVGYLRPISPSLLALPMQAIPCGLAGVQPVGERWSDKCLLAVQQRISNRILRIDIQGAQEGKALVAMVDEASDPQANIAELLISAGYAAAVTITTSSDQQVDQTVISAKPHVPAPACEPLVWSFSEIPCDGQTVALQTTFVANPGEFYCRIDSPTDHQRLLDLRAELKQHCESDNSPFEPKVGEPCCVMSPGDGVWYRAMVKALSDSRVSVNLVDYGFTIKVERHHLRPIKPQLLTLPFQAICCWLSGVEPLGSEWSSEALLWFQTLVDGKQLSARVLSVTKQGHGVELESRGCNVAAALISEQLAKVPAEILRATHANAGSAAVYQECAKENEHSHGKPLASNQTGAKSEELPKEVQAAVPSEAPSFPVDWKTVELPLNETFKPYIAAAISPSLFYILAASQVDQQKLQLLMKEVAAYCSNNQASLSSDALSRPGPGAACCAQFSADNNWYRAVVLDIGENEMKVIYADYGNRETVPFSRVLPIPLHLLQLPFQITRCTLTGKEHFPVDWPEEVQQLFQIILSNSVLASVQSFDGSANILSLTLPTESGEGHVSAMILDALQALNNRKTCPSPTQKPEHPDSSSPSAITPAEPPRPLPTPETQKEQKHPTTTSLVVAPEPTTQTHQQIKNAPAESLVPEAPAQKTEATCRMSTDISDPQTSGCRCLSLESKIDRLEQLLQLQLSLIKQLAGHTK
ncbi:hypothetical protein JOB18_042668 [Solea senegalensis]|uniref:Tudor domain-containing protein 1 n=1 Tax=Solea senegalensis TaxID=28829 RepID=A0AAV6RUI7_SOLSE|nr:tudor domain-containing protein 1 isoform X1 [Solea senegalensis]KAG7507722.1 hypothetical protein JOB18_042668 [Solea senegalensis]